MNQPKRRVLVAQLLFLLCVVFGVGAYVWNGCKPIREFDHLEQNAQKTITGSELQHWATNLISLHRTNTWLRFRGSELGTNLPPQLRSLVSRMDPRVTIYQEEETNQTPWVRIEWGSGFLGRAGFEIGPMNFESQRGRQWQPGVYFFMER